MIVRVVLIGGSIEALLLSIELSSQHDITIIELEAEIGLPVQHPGRIMDPSTLHHYFTSEQISFLELKENEDSWGCRWDWVMKHFAAVAARQNVSFFTRTRIQSCTKHDNTYVLELTSSERTTPTHMVADRVVLMADQAGAPGGRAHHFSPSRPSKFPSPETTEWFGGTVLSGEADVAAGADLMLARGDGMTELWWSTSSSWVPQHGYLEQCRVHLSSKKSELSLDSVMSRVRDFLTKFV